MFAFYSPVPYFYREWGSDVKGVPPAILTAAPAGNIEAAVARQKTAKLRAEQLEITIPLAVQTAWAVSGCQERGWMS